MNPPKSPHPHLERSQLSPKPAVFEISSSDEDSSAPTKRNPSPASQSPPLSKKTKTHHQSHAHLPPSSHPSPPPFHDRQQRFKLEAQRLARQRDRDAKRDPSNPVATGLETTSNVLSKPNPQRANIGSVAALETQSPESRFWIAAIRPTFNRWHPHTPKALKIEDIIGPKDRIRLALVSSYVVDLAWLHNLFAPSTRIVVVKHGQEAGTFKVNERQNMFLCHPSMKNAATGRSSKGCMHVKFFVIYYEDFCRVAIPTANAVDFDYDSVENSVWIQDFPRIDEIVDHPPGKPEPNSSPAFRVQLEQLLKHMDVPSVFIKSLSKFEFCSAAAKLVFSLPGSHPLPDCDYGQQGFARQLKSMGLQSGPGTGRSLRLECQGSSIGSYDAPWLKYFFTCASGFPDLHKKQEEYFSEPALTILFPTLNTVKESRGGTEGGGTLFCNKATWQKAGFPTELFADARSKRSGVLMHVKMILGFFSQDTPTVLTSSHNPSVLNRDTFDGSAIGFLYLGSHNFTPAAWGRPIAKRGSELYSHLDISNWEAGLIIPLTPESELEELVPWERPVKMYGHSGKDSKIPWMQYSYRH